MQLFLSGLLSNCHLGLVIRRLSEKLGSHSFGQERLGNPNILCRVHVNPPLDPVPIELYPSYTYAMIHFNIIVLSTYRGAWGGVVVKALRY